MRRRIEPVLLSIFLALLSTGCVSHYFRDDVDWQTLHKQDSESPALQQIAAAGFDSCKNLLSDAVLHATDGESAYSLTGWSPTSTDHRPATITLVFEKNGDTLHADVTAGLDASGKCFARWQLNRVWRASCSRVKERAESLADYNLFASVSDNTSVYRSEASGISVILTQLGAHRCLMTSGETGYWEGEGKDLSNPSHGSNTEISPSGN